MMEEYSYELIDNSVNSAHSAPISSDQQEMEEIDCFTSSLSCLRILALLNLVRCRCSVSEISGDSAPLNLAIFVHLLYSATFMTNMDMTKIQETGRIRIQRDVRHHLFLILICDLHLGWNLIIFRVGCSIMGSSGGGVGVLLDRGPGCCIHLHQMRCHAPFGCSRCHGDHDRSVVAQTHEQARKFDRISRLRCVSTLQIQHKSANHAQSHVIIRLDIVIAWLGGQQMGASWVMSTSRSFTLCVNQFQTLSQGERTER